MIIAEVRDLVKRYPSFELKSVSFDLESGQITGFIGRNGAGKTTTIKSMLNMIHPDSGTVRYFDRPLTGNEAEIKKRNRILCRDNQLVPEEKNTGHC